MPGAGGTAPGVDCRAAAVAFEQSAKLPPGLLLAIGQVESGRADATTGEINPWPWATNNAGEGHFFASPQEAIAWVAAEQAVGNQSIDVGCFQVNLHYHPDAFASLADAFDPSANARYAANLLNRLHDQSGSWPLAIALYHSAEPFRANATARASWQHGIAAARSWACLTLLPSTRLIRSLSGWRRQRRSGYGWNSLPGPLRNLLGYTNRD